MERLNTPFIVGKTYARQHIVLDRQAFCDCHFVDCTFTLTDSGYTGGFFSQCKFLSCTFVPAQSIAVYRHTVFTHNHMRLCAFQGGGFSHWRASELAQENTLDDCVISRAHIEGNGLDAWAVHCTYDFTRQVA